IIKAAFGGVVTINSVNVSVDGLLVVENGSIRVNNNASGPGKAIISGGTLSFGSASSLDVEFTPDRSGGLSLIAPTQFSGQISNFSIGNGISIGKLSGAVSSFSYDENA